MRVIGYTYRDLREGCVAKRVTTVVSLNVHWQQHSGVLCVPGQSPSQKFISRKFNTWVFGLPMVQRAFAN